MRESKSFCSRVAVRLLLAACAMSFAGCTEPAPKVTNRYPVLAPREVPDYLKDSILQYADMSGTEPFPISGYGLVTHLHGTGGSRVPTPVRAFMLKELARHEFGSFDTGWASPEQVLNDKNVAVVRVDGLIPPGSRAGTDWGTWFDVQVSIPPESDATSLAHGDLYQCDLKINGANPSEPGGGMVAIKAQAAGAVFVNPQYVLDSSVDTAAARVSRKTGVVLAGARVMEDRPLLLRLRSPGTRMSRVIEQCILDRFQDVVDEDLRPAAGADNASGKKVADAHDEGVVYVYVPKVYAGDWEHFAGLVKHLYLKGADPEFAALKSRQLADEAVKPDAKLLDISYCWEGLGKPALHALQPLMSSDVPDVQFAAARAAAFLGDPAAVTVLLAIADQHGNPFRVNAVQCLAELPPTSHVDRLCRKLLDSDEALVRIEAYKLLAKHQDSSVYSRWITDSGGQQVFALDLIKSSAPPMVYATRQGVPRIAVFGSLTRLELPLIYSSMDNRLTISSDDQNAERVNIFYRGQELRKPVSLVTTPSLPELVQILGGDTAADFSVHGLHFGYADVVAILQSLIDQQRVSGLCGQQRLLASFVLQEPGRVLAEPSEGRPLMRDEGGSRPQSDRPAPNQKPAGEDHLLKESSAAAGPVIGNRQ
jgi:flagellar basal body P-ring protein FlgI